MPIAIISQLNTQPACAPVNASPTASRPSTHDSGSGWFAIPFLYDSCIRYSTPVYPGAPDRLLGASMIRNLPITAAMTPVQHSAGLRVPAPKTLPLFTVTGLVKEFAARRGMFDRDGPVIRAVDGVSFTIDAGRTLGIVGESGCGKSTLAKLVLGLEEPTRGSISFEGNELATLDRAERRQYRSRVQAVLQNPYSSLNPRQRVKSIISEPLIVNGWKRRSDIDNRVRSLLDLVGLPQRAFDQFPHEFSGGQRQRIAIARALAIEPKVVVLDEPVSALDVSIRAQILNLLSDLQQELGMAYLFIAHDLAAVAHMSHTIAVMYLGRIVEYGDADLVAQAPSHPYAQALFSAALPFDPGSPQDEVIIEGEVASAAHPPPGCHFHPRCPYVMPICREQYPPFGLSADRLVACHLRPVIPIAVADTITNVQ